MVENCDDDILEIFNRIYQLNLFELCCIIKVFGNILVLKKLHLKLFIMVPIRISSICILSNISKTDKHVYRHTKRTCIIIYLQMEF